MSTQLPKGWTHSESETYPYRDEVGKLRVALPQGWKPKRTVKKTATSEKGEDS